MVAWGLIKFIPGCSSTGKPRGGQLEEYSKQCCLWGQAGCADQCMQNAGMGTMAGREGEEICKEFQMHAHAKVTMQIATGSRECCSATWWDISSAGLDCSLWDLCLRLLQPVSILHLHAFGMC